LKGADWEKYWKADDTKLVHFIGKDNIVFHCIIFPAMLMADGRFIAGADNVPANEFMNLEGDKISTSRNWAVWLHEYLEQFPNQQDVLRYVLTANAPESKDSEFTWKDFQTRNNSELVGIFANFFNRVIVLTQKNFEGIVPQRADLQEIDEKTIQELENLPKQIGEAIENYKFREALALVMDLARLGNKYLAETEPWKQADKARVGTILNISLQISASLAIVVEPFLPFTAKKMRDVLKLEKADWSQAGNVSNVADGTTLNPSEHLFTKIEDAVVEAQIQKLLDTKKMNEIANKTVPELKPTIQYDDFAKLDIRVGTILEAEKMPKSDKLLKFLIDDGIEKRVILSGIAKHYSPEEMIGKQVTFIANLAPRKMMGTESNGMILMAEDRDGALALLQPNKSVWNGGVVS
jgi:methionyl-tRNA synthetase